VWNVFTILLADQAVEQLLQLWHSPLGGNQDADRGLHRDELMARRGTGERRNRNLRSYACGGRLFI